MDNRNVVTLLVDGTEYSGWTEMSVTRSLEAISGSFTITHTERWDDTMAPRPIAPSQRCQLLIGGDLVIDGYVDDARPSFSDSSHSVTITGRDMTCDLVDCSCMLTPDQFAGVTLAQLCQHIVKPFGIEVRDDAQDGEKFARFKIQQGETGFEAIDRACRQRAILPISLPGVGLVLRRSDDHVRAPDSPLIQGENILAASSTLSAADRFSEYVVRGQRETSDLNTPGQVSYEGRATDANIRRHRPMMQILGSGATAGIAQRRAEWEASMRAARGATASITVQGWRRESGELWLPGVVVPVRSEWLRLNGEYLIKTVTLSLSETGGITAVLEVTDPEAFVPRPEIPDESAGAGSGSSQNVSIWSL